LTRRYIKGVSKPRKILPVHEKTEDDRMWVTEAAIPYLVSGDTVSFNCQCGSGVQLAHPIIIKGWDCGCGIRYAVDLEKNKIVGSLHKDKLKQAVEMGGVKFV